MRINRALVLCAAVAFVSAGCEVHERDRVEVGADVAVAEPEGAVIDAPGVEVVDVEPDPVQRVYVYDEGYPPGTYIYNNYYYYGGHRYPRDVFVNRYVQENIRQHRFTDKEQNRRQGQIIEQRHRTEFTQNHGVRQNRALQQNNRANQPTPVRPNEQRPENKAAEERRPEAARPENRVPANEERRPEVARPENHLPTEERRPAVERPENKPRPEERRPAVERPENKPNPANEERKRTPEEEKREEGK